MADTPLHHVLRTLGYTQAWIDLGVLDEARLRQQFGAYGGAEESRTEHIRHRTFDDFLRRQDHLSDEEVDQVLALQDDSGFDLGTSRAIQLLTCHLLTDQQFEALATHPAVASPPVRRVYERHHVLRRLRAEPLHAELLEAAQDTGDAAVHRTVLERDDLTRAQLEWFATQGATRAVRHIAAQRLRGRRG